MTDLIFSSMHVSVTEIYQQGGCWDDQFNGNGILLGIVACI